MMGVRPTCASCPPPERPGGRRLAGAMVTMVVCTIAWTFASACSLAPSTGVAGEGSDELRAGLTEWQINTVPDAARPGVVTFTVTNAGSTDHDLEVTAGRRVAATPRLAPGDTATLTIPTGDAERLRLVCTLPGHARQGMTATLPVQR